MAWLIALALFLCIGTLICSSADRSAAKRSQRIMLLQDQQTEFVASLYVLGWNYFQEMEPDILRKAQSAGLDDLYGYDLEVYSEAIYGKPISQIAIEKALRDMIVHQETMFSYEESGTTLDDIHKKLVPALDTATFSAESEAARWEEDIKYYYAAGAHLQQFDLFFNAWLAGKVKSDWIKKQIPRYDDPRTYKDALGVLRAGVPHGYESEIQKKRIIEQAADGGESWPG